jgi:hypothetical protein
MSGSTISTSATKLEALQLQSSAYGVTVAKGYGLYKTSGNLLDHQGFKAISHTDSQEAGKGGGTTMENTTYTYTASVLMAIGHGTVTAVRRVWRGKESFGALSDIGLSFFAGAIGQSPWAAMASINASHSLGYSGLAYVAGQDYNLGDAASLANHNFEVQDQFAYTVSSSIPDANMADVVGDILPNNRYGAGFTGELSLASYSTYCRAAGLLMSPVFSEQSQAAEMLRKVAELTNTAIVWSDNKLKLIPYAETEVSGNGVTFTPDTQVRYDLTIEHFCDKETPIKQARLTTSDRFNHYRVEFKNRANDYAPEIAEDKDDVDIEVKGHRPADVIQAHWICDAAVAQRVAGLLLKRSLYILNRWTFELPWHFCRLEPMDIVTLTDPLQGLNKKAVRIVEKSESGDQLVFVAEDFLAGTKAATASVGATGGGVPVDFNADPGSVLDPVFFEGPVELSSTGLEVMVAVNGHTEDWGGCDVWASNDGTNYKRITTLFGGSRYGTLTNTLAAAPGGALSMQLLGNPGQLQSGSQLDSERLTTLCWVKGTVAGAKGEYLAYQTATLTGSGQYTLTGLTRGGYGSDQGSKDSGSVFVRVDGAVAKSGALPLDMIGRQLYFKFTSFNRTGGAKQTLDECSEYLYTVTGEMVALPPAAITSMSAASRVFGIDLSWVVPARASRIRATEVWVATSNSRTAATLLGEFAYPQSAHQMTAMAPGATRWFWARLVDIYGNYGAWYPSSPSAGVPGGSSSDATEILDYLSGKIGLTQLSTELQAGMQGVIDVGAITTSLASMYTIKTSLTVDGRLYMAGLGVGVENTEGVVESQVLVAADRFAVIDPLSQNVTIPFLVDDGVAYINNAFIGDGTITNAKIGNVIASTNYDPVAGTGWSLDKSGYLFLTNINAGAIDVRKLAGTTAIFDTPGTYTFVVPEGFDKLQVTVKGGGGGAGGGRNTGAAGYYTYCGGGGGQGGVYVAEYTGVSSGTVITVTVGAGGAGGNAGAYSAGFATNGAAGGASSLSFTGVSVAAGGGGGGGAGIFVNAYGSPGAGGSGGGSGYNGASGSGKTAGGYGSNNAGGGGIPLSNGQSGKNGSVTIESFNPNGVILRSEWSAFMSHMNARFTGYTWP